MGRKSLFIDERRCCYWQFQLAHESLTAKAAHKIGNGTFPVVCNVADWSSAQRAFESTRQAYDSIDIVVNTVGIAGSNAPLADYSVEEFKTIVEKNLLGTFHVNRVVVPGMRQQRAAARTRIFDQMAQEHIDYMLAKIPRDRFLELHEAAAMIA